ncbi:MAG TPA: FmdB family transcriptional regulator [Phycisphaerales bacterium]|nr:FmdB family transcriptional regulator [Phycisphaerales bacterium]
MPTYEYEILDDAGEPTGERFEWVQSMKDDALTTHPETGRPCRRAIVATNIAGNWSPLKDKSRLSNKNLEKLGFTKYEKRGDGVMERTAGKEGPRVLKADD